MASGLGAPLRVVSVAFIFISAATTPIESRDPMSSDVFLSSAYAPSTRQETRKEEVIVAYEKGIKPSVERRLTVTQEALAGVRSPGVRSPQGSPKRTCKSFEEVTPGKWRTAQGKNSTRTIFYDPAGCALPASLTSEQVGACLAKRGVSRMAILGDSQVGRYGAALRKLLPSPHAILAQEGAPPHVPGPLKDYTPDIRYYSARNISNVKVHVRDCADCRSALSQNGGIQLDQFVSEFVMDDEVTRRNDSRPNTPTPEDAWTTQEFVTKWWWRRPRDRPQLVVLLATTVHDIARRLPPAYLRDLAWAVDLWTSWSNATSAEFLFLDYHLLNTGQAANSKLRSLNALWRRVVARAARQSSLVGAGPDIEAISETIPKWVYLPDGVHFHPVWYEAVMEQILLPMWCL